MVYLKRYAVAILLILALLLLATSAEAGKEQGTKTLEWGDHIDIRIDIDEGDSLKIEYNVKVIEGVAVNVYFLDSKGYQEYISPQATEFGYYVLWSSLSTKSAAKDFTWSETGTHYVVIDNTHSSFNNTTVEYTVKWEPPSEAEVAFWYICGGLVVVVVIVGWFYRLRRIKRALTQPPAQPPPMPPGYQPPPGYEPEPGPQPSYQPSEQPPPPEQPPIPPPDQGGPPGQ